MPTKYGLYGRRILLAANVRGELTSHTEEVLSAAMERAGVEVIMITSMERTPYEQARAMLTNIKLRGVQSQYSLYGPVGDQVIRRAEYLIGERVSEQEILRGMLRLINLLGPQNVSHHCADKSKCQVVDISPLSVLPRDRFDELERECRTDKRIRKVKSLSDGDPALHVEIDQPEQLPAVAPSVTA
jgi:hypothetical protein